MARFGWCVEDKVRLDVLWLIRVLRNVGMGHGVAGASVGGMLPCYFTCPPPFSDV